MASRGSRHLSATQVHAWSHSYADVAAVAAALAKESDTGGDGGVEVEVVSPSELLRRVADQAWAVGCTCDTPGAAGPGAGHNGYSCTDGTRAYCASDEACYAALEFAKGDWRSGCGKPSAEAAVEEVVGAGVQVEV